MSVLEPVRLTSTTFEPPVTAAPPPALRVEALRSDALFAWLFAGGLAHPSGAIAGWRDHRTGQLSDEYPEITGYYLSAAAFADASERTVVASAADWLCARIETDELAGRRADGPAIYNFDVGIIAAGLLKYGMRTGRNRPLTAGLRAARSLRDQIGEFGHLPTFHPRAGRPEGRPTTWSTVGRLHLAKTVQCLLLAADWVSGAEDAARMLVERARRDFSLTSDQLRESNGLVNFHATCYALEGLWIWNAAQGISHDALLETSFDTLIAHRLPSGGMPRNAGTPTREQCDVLSQVVRLAALLGRLASAERSIDRLRALGLHVDHGRALPYQPDSPDVHENAWATMFAAQALALVERSAPLEWWELI